jgi:acetyl-CoA synthetase
MVNEMRLDTYHFYEQEWDSYEELYEWFEWQIPSSFNIANYVCERWASEDEKTAVFAESPADDERTYTFTDLSNITNQLANYFVDQGIGDGDYIGVNVPQKPENLFTFVAAWKVGAIPVPLTTLFGTDALEYRLADCNASACIVDETNIESFRGVKTNLDTVLTVGDVENESDERGLWNAIGGMSTSFDMIERSPKDDALLFYTSGTTGKPKGVRHTHELLLGCLPQYITMKCNLEMNEDDIHWNVAEWTWMGSLFVTVFPSLFYGRPVVAYHNDSQFDAEQALSILEKYDVTNFFAPPTALRRMEQVLDVERFDTDQLRVILSGGEELGQNITDWAADTFDGAVVHEGYGLTEAHATIADCRKLLDFHEGKIGKLTPGHEVGILDPETHKSIEEPGEIGEIAVRYENDPVCMKGYWNRPQKTDEVFKNGWMLTSDLGMQDADGFFSFVGRKDDVIICSGYKIGPEEIEDSLSSHEAVLDAGVIGVPDDNRGEIPKAYVILTDGYEPSEQLETAIKDHVRSHLAQYEYPREIEFVDELPTTSTGKIRRVELREREGISDCS